ncbi:hypothetical protein FH972_012566 [Carpinus fangiana]|uniref:NmrA-like domain-containing protein n=1 Tax=Carpinus fangiana TaxID=176857 RepID=A0A5N6R7B5_9ROSI|nr:hypothetical protein FH972_012566 [Carpinus fangiana]
MASLVQGHATYVLQRPETGLDIGKAQMLLSFKQRGARLVEGSFSDHRSLVDAVKQVDFVICTMSGVHFRSHNLLLQLQLVEAIKEAGNIKVYLYIYIYGRGLPAREVGGTFMEKLERSHTLSQSACNMRTVGIEDMAELLEKRLAFEISKMTLEEALTLACAFSHYLNLTGIAETHHRYMGL